MGPKKSSLASGDGTSATIQNEILTLLANAVLRQVVNDVISLEPVQFSIMVDGTRDISGIEHEIKHLCSVH